MVEAVLAGLAQLRARNAEALSDGLGATNARRCLDLALDAITVEGLKAEIGTTPTPPQEVCIVCARGVFTAPIEWIAMLAAAGCTIHIKAPSGGDALVRALTEDFRSQGIAISVSTDRDLGQPDTILAFGSDASVKAIRTAHSQAHTVGYGHRFSLALVTGPIETAAAKLATDISLYDTRGCMAPTAIFTTHDPETVASVLHEALQQEQAVAPRGEVDEALGPEWRRRIGLARVLGTARLDEGIATLTLPAAHFVPAALPRMAIVHGIEHTENLSQILSPWREWLSTVATDQPDFSLLGAHRVCALGQMQSPPFPRKHDGNAMLRSLVQPN